MPGACTFISDCKVMMDGLKDGKRKAVHGSSTHARVYALLFNVIDDLPLDQLIWMPAHQKAGAIGVKAKSDGKSLTARDIK